MTAFSDTRSDSSVCRQTEGLTDFCLQLVTPLASMFSVPTDLYLSNFISFFFLP